MWKLASTCVRWRVVVTKPQIIIRFIPLAISWCNSLIWFSTSTHRRSIHPPVLETLIVSLRRNLLKPDYNLVIMNPAHDSVRLLNWLRAESRRFNYTSIMAEAPGRLNFYGAKNFTSRRPRVRLPNWPLSICGSVVI
jgi:hypothetical protein